MSATVTEPKPDTAMDAIKKLDEPGAFIVRKAVPIFMEHEADGEKVDRNRLEELAAINNRRVTEDATPGSIIIGHTPGRKEEDLINVGYHKNYRVAEFGPKAKLGLLADFYYKHDKYAKAQDYPHRSIELWGDGIIDTVSVLARTPKLDLGLLLPDDGATKQTQVASYGKDGADLLCYSRGGERRIYQLSEEPPMPKLNLIDELKNLLTKAQEDPGAYGLAAGSNDLVTYSKSEHKALLKDQEALQKERDEAVKERDDTLKLYQKQERTGALEKLKSEGVVLDVEAELADTASLSPEAFTKHIEKVKKCYQRSPVGSGGFIPTGSPPAPQGEEYDREKVRNYATTHGVSIPQAREAVQAGKA